jgi:hypothetical protein
MGAAVEDLQFGKFLRGCVLHLVNLQTGRLGWKTTVGKHGVDMAHEKTGVRAMDVSIWHDTPWV